MKQIFEKLIARLPDSYKRAGGRHFLRAASETANQRDLAGMIGYLEALLLELEDRSRRQNAPVGQVRNWAQGNSGPALEYQVMPGTPPWWAFEPRRIEMPGMLTAEEAQYYHFIAQYYTGCGEVVELGPWLGLSTCHLIDALVKNENFTNHKLNVYDDFVWRSDWMNGHYGKPNCPAHHADFRHLFEDFTREIGVHLVTHKGKFTDYDGNEDLPVVTWGGLTR
jgi:hypothetical protein